MILSFEGTDFSCRFPKSQIPRDAETHFGGDLATYRSWRRLILDAQLIAEPCLVDSDPWDTIIRVARICRGAAFSSRIYHVSSRLPTGTAPIAVNRRHAIEIDANLSGQDRASFRQGLGALDALQAERLAQQTGLLPDRKVGRLLKPGDHRTRYPLAPRLARIYEEMPTTARPALVFAWRMAVMGGIFSLDDDPGIFEFMSEDRARALLALRVENYGIEQPSQDTYVVYLKILGRFCLSIGGSGLPDCANAIDQAWAALRTLAKQLGVFSPARLANISAVSTPAKRDGLAPRDLTPEWFSSKQASLTAQKRRAFDSGCYVIEEMCVQYGQSNDVLPLHGTGLNRQRRQR